MYYQYFGLNEAPFSISVDPRFLFMSPRHRDALAHLSYGVGTGGGFILLTGEVGTGKTTLVRQLLQQLPPDTEVALILNPALNAVELLATACDELGVVYKEGESSLKVLTDKLHHYLLDNYAKGRNTVLLIDEAQHLQFDVLEQIRLLTNLETNTQKLLQIILVGQPELRSKLNRPELRQLAQRITARYQLKPLNRGETQSYIEHRLRVAGLDSSIIIFPHSIFKLLHRISAGVPRVINVLCDRMLLGAYGKNSATVDRQVLRRAAREVSGNDSENRFFDLLEPYFPTIKLGLLLTLVVSITAISLNYYKFTDKLTDGASTDVSATDLTSRQALKSLAALDSTSSTIVPSNFVPDVVRNVAPATENTWYEFRDKALHTLAQAVGSDNFQCRISADVNYRCEIHRVNSWQELLSYNRPAMLSLLTPSKFTRYAVLLRIENLDAILKFDGREHRIKLEQLGPIWTGEIVFFWRPPDSYNGAISKGDSTPLVSWLATQFSILDNQEQALTDRGFNEPLEQRVRIFQSRHRLTADGVVGLKTLLALEAKIDSPLTLNKEKTAPSPFTLDGGR